MQNISISNNRAQDWEQWVDEKKPMELTKLFIDMFTHSYSKNACAYSPFINKFIQFSCDKEKRKNLITPVVIQVSSLIHQIFPNLNPKDQRKSIQYLMEKTSHPELSNLIKDWKDKKLFLCDLEEMACKIGVDIDSSSPEYVEINIVNISLLEEASQLIRLYTLCSNMKISIKLTCNAAIQEEDLIYFIKNHHNYITYLNLKEIDLTSKFYQKQKFALPNLKTLIIKNVEAFDFKLTYNLSILKVLNFNGEIICKLPKHLQKLSIKECPNLLKFEKTPFVKTLILCSCPKLEVSIFTYNRDCRVNECPKVGKLEEFLENYSSENLNQFTKFIFNIFETESIIENTEYISNLLAFRNIPAYITYYSICKEIVEKDFLLFLDNLVFLNPTHLLFKFNKDWEEFSCFSLKKQKYPQVIDCFEEEKVEEANIKITPGDLLALCKKNNIKNTKGIESLLNNNILEDQKLKEELILFTTLAIKKIDSKPNLVLNELSNLEQTSFQCPTGWMHSFQTGINALTSKNIEITDPIQIIKELIDEYKLSILQRITSEVSFKEISIIDGYNSVQVNVHCYNYLGIVMRESFGLSPKAEVNLNEKSDFYFRENNNFKYFEDKLRHLLHPIYITLFIKERINSHLKIEINNKMPLDIARDYTNKKKQAETIVNYFINEALSKELIKNQCKHIETQRVKKAHEYGIKEVKNHFLKAEMLHAIKTKDQEKMDLFNHTHRMQFLQMRQKFNRLSEEALIKGAKRKAEGNDISDRPLKKQKLDSEEMLLIIKQNEELYNNFLTIDNIENIPPDIQEFILEMGNDQAMNEIRNEIDAFIFEQIKSEVLIDSEQGIKAVTTLGIFQLLKNFNLIENS